MNEQLVSQRLLTQEQIEDIQRAFVLKVYSWMFAGLMITGIISLLTIQSEAVLQVLLSNRILFFGLFFVQLGLVIWLSARIQKMSAATATTVFLGYSAVTGLTLSVIFLAYTAESLASTFFVTAGTFGAMSFYGYVTKRDLTSFGGFLTMGLIGMVIASIVNIWLANSTVYWITTYIGIFIFVGLTAYDAQRIKNMSGVSLGDEESEQKGAIIGALSLYLDFINLFLMLLRLMGNRR